jgi:hypothetical protein
MPIPKPRKGEKENEFMHKCMSDETMNKEFPEQKQRVAICINQMKRRKAKASSLEWEDTSEDSFILY